MTEIAQPQTESPPGAIDYRRLEKNLDLIYDTIADDIYEAVEEVQSAIESIMLLQIGEVLLVKPSVPFGGVYQAPSGERFILRWGNDTFTVMHEAGGHSG